MLAGFIKQKQIVQVPSKEEQEKQKIMWGIKNPTKLWMNVREFQARVYVFRAVSLQFWIRMK